MLEKLSDSKLKQINHIIELGINYDWDRIHTSNLYMISFRKDKMRINIYTTTMTIATALAHPTKGKTQLYRRNVDLKIIEKIFKNPRVHTKKGYYTL